jgi:hypothetical protein
MTTEPNMWPPRAPSRGSVRPQTAPNGFGGGIPAGTAPAASTGRTELRTVTPAP